MGLKCDYGCFEQFIGREALDRFGRPLRPPVVGLDDWQRGVLLAYMGAGVDEARVPSRVGTEVILALHEVKHV